jgi:hypothetical protein
MRPNDLRGRIAIRVALIYRTHTPFLTIATNSFLYQDNQRGLATCSDVIYLIDTCSASAVYGRSQVARAETLLDHTTCCIFSY